MLEKLALLQHMGSGDDLPFRAVSSQVLSACGGLTSVFGMGTGGTLQLLSPENVYRFQEDGCRGGCRSVLPRPRALRALASDPFRDFRFAQVFCLRSASAPLRILKTAQEKLTLSSSKQPSASSDQALDRLVSAHSMRYRTSMSDLSTSSSLRGLTYSGSGSLILQGGFTLRCLQRLSRPHFASLLCPWQNNSFTRGASIPVLSY